MNDETFLAQQSWLGCNGIVSAASFGLALGFAAFGAFVALAGRRPPDGRAPGASA
jgi:hypothetical protein